MKRLKGPELKLSELRAPTFLVDLFHDLRDRRLLPVIGLVLVAIVAVPFLLGESSEEELVPAEGTDIVEGLKSEAGDPATLTVVEAKPGLRDYRKRLQGRQPTDPFEQRYTGAVLNGADLPESKGEPSSGSGSSETAVTETKESGEVVITEPEPGGSGGASPGGSGGGASPGGDGGEGGDAPAGARLYSFAVDLRIVHTSGSEAAGTKQTSEPIIRRHVLPTSSLPSNATQVVTYMGLSPKTAKPIFLVSTEVTAMFGEGKCAAGTDVCQLVELEPGFPQTFEYGEEGDRYKFRVIDVDAVPIGNG